MWIPLNPDPCGMCDPPARCIVTILVLSGDWMQHHLLSRVSEETINIAISGQIYLSYISHLDVLYVLSQTAATWARETNVPI